MSQNLFELIQHGNIQLYPDDQLRSHAAHCAGHPPYGYREATVEDRRTLVVDEEESKVVRTIYRLYLDGNGNGKKFGFVRIAEYLTERQTPTCADKSKTINDKYKTGYGYWHETVAKRIVKAPVYRGKWQYGKHTDNPITIPVPRIISDEDWEATQVIRKKNRRVRKYAGDYDFMLKGMAFCSLCNKPMRVNTQRHKANQLHYYTHHKRPRYSNAIGERCAGHGKLSCRGCR